MASIWPLDGGNGIVTYRTILERALTTRGHKVELLWHDGTRPVLRRSDGRELQDGLFLGRIDPRIAAIDERVRWAERRRYVFELASMEMGLAGYDVIHTQDVISSRAISRVRPAGVAHVATLHGNLVKELEIGMGAGFDDLKRRYFAREEYLGATSTHRTIVPSQALRRQMGELAGIPESALRVMPYGLELDILRAKALTGSAPAVPSGRTVLLCPARLSKVKGHKYLIQAVGQLVQMGKDVELWLAGTGGLEGEMREQTRQLGLLDRVRFLGHRSDVPALMRRSDIVVLASTQEVLSFALLEAQALGKPVVATKALGIPEAVEHGVTGLLCDPAQPNQLAMAVMQIMGDPKLREGFAANAVRRADELFAVGRMANEVLNVYGEAISMAKEAAKGGTAAAAPPVVPDPAIWPLR